MSGYTIPKGHYAIDVQVIRGLLALWITSYAVEYPKRNSNLAVFALESGMSLDVVNKMASSEQRKMGISVCQMAEFFGLHPAQLMAGYEKRRQGLMYRGKKAQSVTLLSSRLTSLRGILTPTKFNGVLMEFEFTDPGVSGWHPLASLAASRGGVTDLCKAMEQMTALEDAEGA